MNFLNQKAFLAISEVVIYSASESVIISYLELFQFIEPILHKKIYLEIDSLPSISDIKSESINFCTINSAPLKIKNISLILLKYLRIFFIAIQCS